MVVLHVPPCTQHHGYTHKQDVDVVVLLSSSSYINEVDILAQQVPVPQQYISS